MTDSHVHAYDKLEIARITRIKNKLYQGVAGDMAFLLYRCECKKARSFDYGAYQLMQDKISMIYLWKTQKIIDKPKALRV